MRTNLPPTDYDRLIAENEALRERVFALEAELKVLRRHPTLAAGMRGEQLAAAALNGVLSTANAGHDMHLASGSTIEVKTSALTRPLPNTSSLRWVWTKVLGSSGGKRYDYLLLIGDADPRFQTAYKDPASPYVFFLVPFDDVAALGNPTRSSLGIQLVSNPGKARGVSAPLFERFQVTLEELKHRLVV